MEAYINLFIPQALEISANGVKESRLISLPKDGFSSKLGSFEIHAR